MNYRVHEQHLYISQENQVYCFPIPKQSSSSAAELLEHLVIYPLHHSENFEEFDHREATSIDSEGHFILESFLNEALEIINSTKT